MLYLVWRSASFQKYLFSGKGKDSRVPAFEPLILLSNAESRFRSWADELQSAPAGQGSPALVVWAAHSGDSTGLFCFLGF